MRHLSPSTAMVFASAGLQFRANWATHRWSVQAVAFVPPRVAFASTDQHGSKLSPLSLHVSRAVGMAGECEPKHLRMVAGGGTAGSARRPAAPKGGEDAGGAAMGPSIFNLVKNIVGSGILALPGGVAAFSQARAATLPATALIVSLGALSGYCFSLIGRACASTGSKTYGEAWGRTVDGKTSWLPMVSCTAKTFFACLSYSIIIGDVFSDVAKTMALPAWASLRANVLTIITSLVLLPLCLMKDLKPLSVTSILGIFGTLYTAGVMVLRYFDGSYAAGGKYFASMAAGCKPMFEGGSALTPISLILVSMLSTSFIAHYNAPKYYNGLKDKSIPRYNTVVGVSFLASIALFVVMTIFPFLTFGGNSNSFILNNYSRADKLATMCRLAIGLSITFGYPLTFITAREGVLQAAGVTDPTDRDGKVATVSLLALFTVVAIALQDLGFVVSFGGALLGSAVIYVFPALMWVMKCRKDIKIGNPPTGWRRMEYLANYGIIGIGTLLGVLGAVISVLKTFVWT